MNLPFEQPTKGSLKLIRATTLVLMLIVTGSARAQFELSSAVQIPPPPAPIGDLPAVPAPPSSMPAGDSYMTPGSNCAGCARGGSSGCSGGCGSSGGCIAGRKPCALCESDSSCLRFFGGLYEGICCPDPCYEARWVAEANAAFGQDGPRPVTQTRIRWEAGLSYGFPDTAEFFWGKIGSKGPMAPESGVSYNGLSLYQEIAAKNFSFFIEIPYLSIEPNNNPSASGLGDINLGTKAVLLDTDLLLLTFQFRTYIPSGNFTAGIGTGHTSLEPSILGALKIASATYLQFQLGEWIPVGGTSGFMGSVFEYHLSLNHSLYKVNDAIDIIGTMEVNGFAFRGQFTDTSGNIQSMGGASYVNAGPGVRFTFCNRYDLGVGMGFDLGTSHGPEQIYRTEFRVRF